MINYHAVISDYKKSFKEKLAGATSEDYQMHHEFQGRPKVVHARDPEQFNMKENRNDKKGEIGGDNGNVSNGMQGFVPTTARVAGDPID